MSVDLLARLRAAPGPQVVSSGPIEHLYRRALSELVEHCVAPLDGSEPVLLEGGPYRGAWLESTGSISAEVLGRFLPDVAASTFRLFAQRCRADGLLPYKVTDAGPAYRQIQMVTPLARSVWNQRALLADDLPALYRAMAGNDAWLARHRDTRGTGCVEAFCTFDTGHDQSPRFWHVPDTTPGDDPARYDPHSPILPFLAPDLTANVACQRGYLARIAAALGEDPARWHTGAAASTAALYEHCYDAGDEMFYDRDATGRFVRVQSDVLLRVLACEIGDGAFFASALSRYLLNTRKFFARYPFTSLAMDDPRFDHDAGHNSWGGPTNFLTLLRAPHAFEHHGHVVELSWVLAPVLEAVARMDRFPQTLHPWTGAPGYTEQYSPTMLWVLDAVERLCGILPRPDGSLWCTALLPSGEDCVGYARGGYEFVHDAELAVLYRDGEELARFPHGWRLVLGPDGRVREVVGMSARPVAGELTAAGATTALELWANERIELDDGGRVVDQVRPGLVRPVF